MEIRWTKIPHLGFFTSISYDTIIIVSIQPLFLLTKGASSAVVGALWDNRTSV
jgi:fucose permease